MHEGSHFLDTSDNYKAPRPRVSGVCQTHHGTRVREPIGRRLSSMLYEGPGESLSTVDTVVGFAVGCAPRAVRERVWLWRVCQCVKRV